MKQLLLLLTAAFALSTGIVRAQSSQLLVIDQLSVPVESTIITDSSAGGRLIYLASVEIALRDNDNLAALQRLHAGLLENRQMNFSLRTMDLNGKITEERFYQNAAVQEIILPALDGAEKSTAKALVRIRSASLSVKENAGTVSSGGLKRSNTVLTANFRLTLGGLPTARIARVSAIRITGNQASAFALEVSSPDAKSWQDWLTGAATKKETGAIEWLAPNFKDVLFRIELKEVEITSTTSQYNANTEGRAITRINVGLKGRVVPGGMK